MPDILSLPVSGLGHNHSDKECHHHFEESVGALVVLAIAEGGGFLSREESRFATNGHCAADI